MAEKKIPFDHQKNKINSAKPRRKSSLLKIVLLFLFIVTVGTAGAVAMIVSGYIEETPPIDHTRLATVETSYLYDVNGVEITALHEEQNRIFVPLDDIPLHVQNAFIAIEDERYYEHFGWDIIGSIRAAIVNFQAGSIVQGASTLTQQLAQNAFLTTETSYKRKIQEIWLAIQLERNYSKAEILELYLNRFYFGNGAYGVEAASQTYFNKSVSDITIAEGAMLAAAVKSPNYYNPFDNSQAAEERMSLVLDNMLRLEFINEEEHTLAKNQRLRYTSASTEEYPFPHFVDYVVHHELIRILSNIPNIGSREEAYKAIYMGGLRVYTTLDPELQSHVEEILRRDELYPTTIYINMDRAKELIAELPANRDLSREQIDEVTDEVNGIPQPQAAVVLADPITGQIKALGGGREYRKKHDEILRFNILRQPGSAIKPIITYGPAFEEGVLAGAGSTLDDSPYINPAGNWFPENFDFRFRGMVTAREALYMSYNIPAIRALEALGPRVGAEYAEDMGITSLNPNERDNLSLTLGALTHGVKAIDMAQAYSVLANQGMKVDLHSVEKIVNRDGDIIYENKKDPRQILSPQSAFLVNDILQDFVTRYLGSALRIDRPVAAKTGTTENWKDVYLVAYTPNLVASFWMGYDEPKIGQIQQGWRYSTTFLREVFLKAFEDLEILEFERPEGIVAVSICNKSGLLPNESCQAAGTVTSDYFIAGMAPGTTCNMHTGPFYNRPPYITTDGRWSARGGPDRIPEDAEEIPPGGLFEMMPQAGMTTRDISLFNAYASGDGITLQWQYNGPRVSGFILTRSVMETGEEQTIEIGSDTRQYVDSALDGRGFVTYTLAAIYPDGSLSESASVTASNQVRDDGSLVRPGDVSQVIVPDVTGTFQAIAEMKLSVAGLRVGAVELRYEPGSSSRFVIEQQPVAGTRVMSGTPVNLVVSVDREP